MSPKASSVLIVEDDDTKRRRISAVLERQLPNAVVTTRRSYQGAVAALDEHPFDLVVLDMTLPTFDREVGESGGRPRVFGGRDLLGEISSKELTCAVLVVTQYERFSDSNESKTLSQLRTELSQAFPRQFKGAIYYSSMQSDWERRLAKRIDSLTNRLR